MEGLRTISTMEELEDYFSVVCRKIEDALADQVTIDSSLIKPLVFKVMTSVGEPYIDTYWMRAFVNFSDKLVDIMQVATQKTLSEEEKKSFQLRVYVKKGSNIYELSMQFADFFNLISCKLFCCHGKWYTEGIPFSISFKRTLYSHIAIGIGVDA